MEPSSGWEHIKDDTLKPGFSADATEADDYISKPSVTRAPCLNDWDDSVDRSGMVELCQYVQRLEAEKQDLMEQVHFLGEQDASHKTQLTNAGHRIELLENALQSANMEAESDRKAKDLALAGQERERARVVSLATLLDEAQQRFEDTERARQHAVFKLSALQATMADNSSQQLLSQTAASLSSAVSTGLENEEVSTSLHERIESYKREIELLRQNLELKDEQTKEKQRIVVELALKSASNEHGVAMEQLKLDCELKLSEWRHEEALRSRETENAMENDRYSIRLEMKHALQRAQIDQRVSYLQAQAAVAQQQQYQNQLRGDGGESSFSFGTLDEVLVRMQMELLRTRRFEALKRLLLIRQSKLNRARVISFCRWRIQTSTSRVFQLHAVLHMHRIASHLDGRQKRSAFNDWKAQTRLRHVHDFQTQALSCWNRMLAVERINHVLQQRTVTHSTLLLLRCNLPNTSPCCDQIKQIALCFRRWQAHGTPKLTALTTLLEPNAKPPIVSGGNEADTAAFQQEVQRLHEQLAASKSEAWRYKRQLLKQFL